MLKKQLPYNFSCIKILMPFKVIQANLQKERFWSLRREFFKIFLLILNSGKFKVILSRIYLNFLKKNLDEVRGQNGKWAKKLNVSTTCSFKDLTTKIHRQTDISKIIVQFSFLTSTNKNKNFATECKNLEGCFS